MEELFLDDMNFAEYSEHIKKIDAAIEKRLSQIIEQLLMATKGVSSGDFHNNLVNYVVKLCIMKGQLSFLTMEMLTNNTEFCTGIQTLDMIV